jgi:peptidoglycan/LPS O-acetylase OafA/YrhL
VIFGTTLGAFAVHCFFVISGYLICGSAAGTTSVARYSWKRGLRIVPALAIALYFSMYLHGVFDKYAGNPVPWIANGSIWTLPWEGICYAITGFAAAFALLTPMTINPVFALSSILVLMGISGELGSNTVAPNLFFLFLGGAFIKLNERSLSLTKIALFGTALIVAMQIPPFSQASRAAVAYIPFAFAPELSFSQIAYFLYLLFLPFPVIYLCTRAPAVPFLRGDYSYGTYIYAWPVQQALVAFFLSNNYALGALELFCASALCTFLLSVFSWRFIERPFLKLKDGALAGLPSRPPIVLSEIATWATQ